MPKIPSKILDSVVYLFKNKEDAIEGKNFGGTAFLVSVPSSMFPQTVYIYVVTNWHVAVKDGASVVRVNTFSKDPTIFEFDSSEWIFEPKYDIAVIPLKVDSTIHKVAVLALNFFITEQLVQDHEIGPGDDVFMVGRFVDHDGKQTNIPAVRFGNISVMPYPLKQPNKCEANSYCIDMHSRTGYSGSPVFIYRTPGYDLTSKSDERYILADGPKLFGLLGIHWGQFPELWEITLKEHLGETCELSLGLESGKFIKGLSGMTCVLPAWNIIEVLNKAELKKQREMGDMAFDMFSQSSIK